MVMTRAQMLILAVAILGSDVCARGGSHTNSRLRREPRRRLGKGNNPYPIGVDPVKGLNFGAPCMSAGDDQRCPGEEPTKVFLPCVPLISASNLREIRVNSVR